jgi:pimeloyl-ACP methyl ester carboxylesterase
MTGTKALFLEDYCRRRSQAFLRFDYFGHGASSGDVALGTVGRWAEDSVAVIDSLTEGRQILVGSSMGGWIMLIAALARASRVHALVGVAPAPDFTEDLVWPRLSSGQQLELREAGAVTLPSEYDPAGYTYRLELFEEGKRHLLMRQPIALECPVRLLHGMRDQAVPWQTSLSLAERLNSRDVTVILVKDGDHRLSREADLARLGRTLEELITP